MRKSWDDVYARELSNHESNESDEGTVWFEESGAEERMIECLSDLALGSGDGSENVPNEEREDLRIIDIGTGNGHILFELRDAGWRADLTGVDYSSASVELARKIALARQTPDWKGRGVAFYTWDALRDPPRHWLGEGFDFVLDKGTFDAISLSDETIDEQGRKGCEVYAEKLVPLVKVGGHLLVTSCNWTGEELRIWFEGRHGRPDIGLQFSKAIPFPSFEFGGNKGQSVSCICLRRFA